jgi:hypothetical protein
MHQGLSFLLPLIHHGDVTYHLNMHANEPAHAHACVLLKGKETPHFSQFRIKGKIPHAVSIFQISQRQQLAAGGNATQRDILLAQPGGKTTSSAPINDGTNLAWARSRGNSIQGSSM